jgi:hypothetical protein
MPNRSASDIAAELESRAKSYDIIGNCDDKEFPASVEYHLSAGGEAARHTARLMREAASLLRAGPAGKMIDPLRALLKELVIDANRLCDRNLGGTYEEDCRRTIAKARALLSAPVGSDREQAEREVFQIVHRGGLDDAQAHEGIHGSFTDADLKAAGQDWGVSAPVGSPLEELENIKDRALALREKVEAEITKRQGSADIRPAIFDPEHYPEDRHEEIDNGNTFIFCDYVKKPRHLINKPRGCIRGAGHSGPHVTQQIDDPVRAPVILTEEKP